MIISVVMSDLSKLTAQDIRETPLDVARQAIEAEMARLQRDQPELHKEVVELGKAILEDTILCHRFGIDYLSANGQERAYYAAIAIEAYGSNAFTR